MHKKPASQSWESLVLNGKSFPIGAFVGFSLLLVPLFPLLCQGFLSRLSHGFGLMLMLWAGALVVAWTQEQQHPWVPGPLNLQLQCLVPGCSPRHPEPSPPGLQRPQTSEVVAGGVLWLFTLSMKPLLDASPSLWPGFLLHLPAWTTVVPAPLIVSLLNQSHQPKGWRASFT